MSEVKEKVSPIPPSQRKYGNLLILETLWFQSVGFVFCRDTVTREEKVFVGVGFGFDETQDIEHVIDRGQKFNKDYFIRTVENGFRKST